MNNRTRAISTDTPDTNTSCNVKTITTYQMTA